MKSLASAFNNMKVSTKIASGFAVILSIMIAVGAYGYFGVAHVGQDFEGYAQRVGVVDAVSEIDREFLSYRRVVREVTSEKDAERAAKLAEEEELRVKAAIERGIKEIPRSRASRQGRGDQGAVRGVCQAGPQSRSCASGEG